MTERVVNLVHQGDSTSMGQRFVDGDLIEGLSATDRLQIRPVAVVNLRARPTNGGRRLPSARLARLPWAVQAAAGRWIYPKADLTHRLDLRLPPGAGPEVLTIHDLGPLRFPDEGDLPPRLNNAIRRARTIVCGSVAAAEEVADRFAVPMPAVIGHGLAARFATAEPLAAAGRAELGIGDVYVVHSGGTSQRKNVPALLDGWSRLGGARGDAELVLCGPGAAEKKRLAAGLTGVTVLGLLDPGVHASLVAGAAAVVVPSLYEGFGLPVIEGLACGVAVVACNRSSLPEVAGGHATLVEPDGLSIAAGLEAVLAARPSAGQVAEWRAWGRSWTWTRTCERHLLLYENLVW